MYSGSFKRAAAASYENEELAAPQQGVPSREALEIRQGEPDLQHVIHPDCHDEAL
jgi:hypothetical protein